MTKVIHSVYGVVRFSPSPSAQSAVPGKLHQRIYQTVVTMFYEVEFTPCYFQYAPPCLELKR